jgi:predicted DNA-binding transcriptional regulator AlpA
MRATTFQSAKIKEVGEALVATGHVSLDEQATVLGLSRSTTWTILQASHKKNGLSASVIKRMLAQQQLPGLVRDKIYEYVDRKATGMYGHNVQQMHRFVQALSRSATRVPNPSQRSGALATARRGAA